MYFFSFLTYASALGSLFVKHKKSRYAQYYYRKKLYKMMAII